MNTSNLLKRIFHHKHFTLPLQSVQSLKRRASVSIILRLSYNNSNVEKSSSTSSSSTSSINNNNINNLKKHINDNNNYLVNQHHSSSSSFKCLCSIKSNNNNQHSLDCLLNHIDNKSNQYSSSSSSPVKLQILYAKKAKGNVICFPGGHIEKGESELVASQRETMEEVGLDLNDSNQFSYLGRLNDRITFDKIALYTFVYLQLNDTTPTIIFNDKEIKSCGWVDLDFYLNNINPSTMINDSILNYESLSSMASRRITHPLLKILFKRFKVPVVVLPIKDDGYGEFRLWGLTLELTSDLIKIGLDRGIRSPIPSMKESNSLIVFQAFNHPMIALFLVCTTLFTLLSVVFLKLKSTNNTTNAVIVNE